MPARPPTFQVTSSDSNDLYERQESLQPGEVRTPAARPTPLLGDWTRGDSTLWDTSSKEEGAQCTPLNSYGREDLWRLPADQQQHPSDSSSVDQPSIGSYQVTSNDTDDDAERVRHTIHQALAASQQHHHNHAQQQQQQQRMLLAQAQLANNGGPYTGASRTYAPYTVSSGNTFTVQRANDSQTVRDVPLSREVSAQELGSRQSSSDASLLAKFRSQSEIISDELYFQAKTFPPPPPSNAPIETRRVRAELWYLVTRKWDITQQMPPPPRSPLPGMEEEARLRLQELTRVPYRGDRWLAQSERWFDVVQSNFPYPEGNTAVMLSPNFVMEMCA